MTVSPRLALPFLMPQQAQKHLTINDTVRLLDVLVQTAVRSADLLEEPLDAQEGDLFILPHGATGTRWGGMATGSLALCENGGFVEICPVQGQIAYVADRRALLVFDGEEWGTQPFALEESRKLGVNAAPSDANRLTVAADSELLTHDARTPGSGDARKVINKRDAAKVASVLLQTGFEGRAEIGLIGDDRLSMRVSNDGATFRPVFKADPATGHVAVATEDAPVCALDVGGPVRPASYARADLPSAGAGAGQIVFVPDAAGGSVLVFSDGTAWRRVTDRAIVT